MREEFPASRPESPHVVARRPPVEGLLERGGGFIFNGLRIVNIHGRASLKPSVRKARRLLTTPRTRLADVSQRARRKTVPEREKSRCKTDEKPRKHRDIYDSGVFTPVTGDLLVNTF